MKKKLEKTKLRTQYIGFMYTRVQVFLVLILETHYNIKYQALLPLIF